MKLYPWRTKLPELLQLWHLLGEKTMAPALEWCTFHILVVTRGGWFSEIIVMRPTGCPEEEASAELYTSIQGQGGAQQGDLHHHHHTPLFFRRPRESLWNMGLPPRPRMPWPLCPSSGVGISRIPAHDKHGLNLRSGRENGSTKARKQNGKWSSTVSQQTHFHLLRFSGRSGDGD